jgi:hypothetical protein
MECALVSKLPEASDWTYEVKLDGYRAIGVKNLIEQSLANLVPYPANENTSQA